MTSFLNQIFYSNLKFDASNIYLLNKWTLTSENALVARESFDAHNKNSHNMNLPSQSIKKIPSTPVFTPILHQKTTCDIYPRQDDALFWCAFIAHYGYIEYTIIENRFKNREIEEKQKIIDNLKRFPKCLKSSNIKVSIVGCQEIQSELMTNAKTSITMLIAICACYCMRIFVENPSKLSYIEFSPEPTNDEIPVHIITISDAGFYSIDIESSSAKVALIVEKYIKLDSPYRPFAGIASYKVVELEEIARKIGFDISNKNMKKTELYQNIIEKCKW